MFHRYNWNGAIEKSTYISKQKLATFLASFTITIPKALDEIVIEYMTTAWDGQNLSFDFTTVDHCKVFCFISADVTQILYQNHKYVIFSNPVPIRMVAFTDCTIAG